MCTTDFKMSTIFVCSPVNRPEVIDTLSGNWSLKSDRIFPLLRGGQGAGCLDNTSLVAVSYTHLVNQSLITITETIH